MHNNQCTFEPTKKLKIRTLKMPLKVLYAPSLTHATPYPTPKGSK